jgi:histidinol-phosphate aminotransferase
MKNKNEKSNAGMPQTLEPLSFLKTLTPYQSSANKVDDEGYRYRLCYNEGAFGPSPSVVQAMLAAAPNMHRYPDMGYAQLRQAIADKYQLDAARIVCGAGSDDLIGLLMHAFVGEGDEVISSQFGFAMYAVAARTVGAKPVIIPENDLQTDLRAMLNAVTDRTKVVFLANPNNPTGSWLTRSVINDFLRALPQHVLFVYDAAYADFMDDEDYSDGFEWAGEQSRVCVLRTFSKIYGLGGLRLGWAYAAKVIIDTLNNVRNPFNVSILAQAGVIAALNDDTFVEKCRTHNTIWREKLFQLLLELGLKPYPSKGNFVLCRFASVPQAQRVFSYLKEKSILTRPMAGYGLPDCIRITVGQEHEMQALFAALREFTEFKNVTVVSQDFFPKAS